MYLTALKYDNVIFNQKIFYTLNLEGTVWILKRLYVVAVKDASLLKLFITGIFLCIQYHVTLKQSYPEVHCLLMDLFTVYLQIILYFIP